MDEEERRLLAREIAEAQRREKEKQLGQGCLVVLVVFVVAWIALMTMSAAGR